MAAYYNENDPFAAQWLRNLIAAGCIAPGDVDDRSILEVRADDLRRYGGQCHFFAGIGVWSHALRLAGVPDSLPVWTGSCPCQPFSAAGQRKGTADDRHLWPVWFDLIRQCKPPIVFGEQVASKDGLGWFDLVSTDLESADYAVGAADLCAAGVGAPHIRQRLWFVAHAMPAGRAEGWPRAGHGQTTRSGIDGSLADANLPGDYQRAPSGEQPLRDGRGQQNPWANAHWLQCSDGKARLVEPSIFPLAHGATKRMGRLRAYGNAICPQVAKAFIEVAMEYVP